MLFRSAEISDRLGVPEADVISMNRRIGGDASLNAPMKADGEGASEWQDWLADESDDQETELVRSQEHEMRMELLEKSMGQLNDRERKIFKARRLKEDPLTLEDLSQKFKVSRERIRQIEVRAFEKVQKSMKNLASEMA